MDSTKPQLDNHAQQLNKNTDAFWQARGYKHRPLDWETRDPKLPPPPELALLKK